MKQNQTAGIVSLLAAFLVAGCSGSPQSPPAGITDGMKNDDFNHSRMAVGWIQGQRVHIYFSKVGNPLSLQDVANHQDGFEWAVSSEPERTPGRFFQTQTKSVKIGHAAPAGRPTDIYVGCDQEIVAGAPEMGSVAANVKEVCKLDLK